MPPRERKPKSSKRATRRSPRKPRAPKIAKSSRRKSARKPKSQARKPTSRHALKTTRTRTTGKTSPRTSRPKGRKSVAKVRPLPAQPEEILFRVEGKMSTFGGPHDLGMAANEDLALFTKADLQNPKIRIIYFCQPRLPGTSGLGRRLNPDQYYFACRWNYAETSREFLRRALARVENPANGRVADAGRLIGVRILLPDVSRTYRQD